ncbi:MAG: hypothetical protein IBX57_01105 [Gammaproteobacteria bacterium]|nr:hypothetical protein [Gammaproteobacteria bacterium]
MKNTGVPFNITIMDLSKEKLSGLKPVSSTDIMGSSGQKLGELNKLTEKELSWQGANNISSNFNEDGLFSISIFGRIGDKERDTRFSYVDIKTKVFHPVIFRTITSLKGLYGDIMSSKAYAVWDEETSDFVSSNESEGSTGYHFFLKHWDKIKFKKTGSLGREDNIKLIEKFKHLALVNKILILPAGLRDVRPGAGNRLEFDEINDVYRSIIGISRTITSTAENVNSPVLNYSRYRLQIAFNEVFNTLETMLKDKKGFVQSKWAKRRVFNGTRNVISSMNTAKKVLGSKHGSKATDTIMGLYQVMKGSLPHTINLIRNSYLSDIVGLDSLGNAAKLVDTKTLKSDMVELPPTVKDRWSTLDGLEKIINTYQDPHNRHKPVIIEDRYLALIYKGPDQTFRVFSDIDELPEGFDRKYVEPISLIEFLYLSGYHSWNKMKVIVTRYPVTGLGSSYPSDVYTRTTMVGEVRHELGPDWKPMGEDFVAVEFPKKEPFAFVDSQIVSPVRMKGLGAD